MQVSIAGLVLLWVTITVFVWGLRLLGVKKLSCPLINVEFTPKRAKPPKGRGSRGDTG